MLKAIVVFMLEIVIISNFAFAGELGDGYKDAKWGMSLDEVTKVLSLEEENWNYESEDEKSIFSILEENIFLKCWFYKNQFYKAEYIIDYKAEDDYKKTRKSLLDILIKKYGKGKKVYESVFGYCVEWKDKITKIIFEMDFYYAGHTFKVIYQSKKIEAQKQKDEEDKTKEKMNKEKREENRKMKKAEDDF